MTGGWVQCSLRMALPNGHTAEWVDWRKNPQVGDVLDGWTVAVVYTGVVCGDCPQCGDRLRYPDSKAHYACR